MKRVQEAVKKKILLFLEFSAAAEEAAFAGNNNPLKRLLSGANSSEPSSFTEIQQENMKKGSQLVASGLSGCPCVISINVTTCKRGGEKMNSKYLIAKCLVLLTEARISVSRRRSLRTSSNGLC